MPSTHAHSHAHEPATVSTVSTSHSQSSTAAAAAAASHSHSFSLPASQFNYNLHLNSAASNSSASRSITPTPASQPAVFRKPSFADQHQQQHQSQHQYQQPYTAQRPIYDTSVPQSRTLYGGSFYPHTNNASHLANSAPHISSALNYPTNSQIPPPTPFSSASLPRTSSLLPPPRITVSENNWQQQPQNENDPFDVSSTPLDPVNDRDDDTVSPNNSRRRGSSKTHSRSSSLGGFSDGFRNLNRWSISTTSSRASNTTPNARNRFSRRVSVDSTSLFHHINQQLTSPRRPPKVRSSTSTASPEEYKSPSTTLSSLPPLAALPPILSLPSLEPEHFGRSSLYSAKLRQESKNESSASQFGNETPTVHETSFLSTSARDRPDSVLPNSAFSHDATMAHTDNASSTFVRGHQRSRSHGLKSSTDSATSPRTRAKQPSQKAMLSKALQKANTAVQLDNAQNYDGARVAYYEACDLLQQVLDRTPGEDDKKKLEAIRKTYSSRIEELEQMLPDGGEDDKALPRTPGSASTGYRTRSGSVASTTDSYATSTRQRSDTNRSQQSSVPNYARPTSAAWRPQMSANTSPKAVHDPRYVTPTPTNFSDTYDRSQPSFSQRSPRRDQHRDSDMFLARPMDDGYMPPPLSPRRPSSPTRPSDVPGRADLSSDRNRLAPAAGVLRAHQRTASHESISWLDPIDESGGSSISSVHSRSSSAVVRRKHIRAPSGDTEAEFNTALDDAIEAAYDDGYEPTAPIELRNGTFARDSGDEVVAQALRKVKVAKERVRQSEMEMQRLATDRDRRMRALQEEEQTLPGGFYDGDDSEEEERILEEMTDGYDIEDFAFDEQSKVRLPRESDSSEFTSRTWHSSTVSNPPTANTVLSSVSEHAPVSILSQIQGPIAPPPTQSLPKLPPPRPSSSSGKDSVRDRRLSGTNAKQLKIETSKLGPKVAEPATAGPKLQNMDLPPMTQPKTAGFVLQRQTLPVGPSRSASLRRGISPGPGMDGPPPTPPVPSSFQDLDNRAVSPALSRPPNLRKNFSSNSLKNMKTRNLSISATNDDYSDVSPGTPLSNPFASANSSRLPAMPSLPTPVAASFRDRMTSAPASGGFSLFDADISSPMLPGDQPFVSDTAPAPLEPCPKDSMLRPFWLMRALYQTLCHPKGGYISNKLFVPRDAWRVKGVKIKNVEDKISQCDLLTAALQKLDMVNTEDADAVLEEMQSLEMVLEQVQIFFTRRLGNDVGVQGSGALFKDADGAVGGPDGQPIPRNNSISSKGTFSWKRLRNKTSSSAISNTGFSNGTGRKESSAADALLNTLPFTDHPTSRPSKRDVTAVKFSGPNAHYMAALARLFDAAQAIDQIARQVEDPGLRHQDKTQVGLELSTRHAAEFFGFYICRFVLQDLTMLLDKFIKRGSEWVLV